MISSAPFDKVVVVQRGTRNWGDGPGVGIVVLSSVAIRVGRCAESGATAVAPINEAPITAEWKWFKVRDLMA